MSSKGTVTEESAHAQHNTSNCEREFPDANASGPGLYCPRGHDNVTCWPATPANTTASILCPPLPRGGSDYYIIPVVEGSNVKAFRNCLPNGEWSESTNYDRCLEIMQPKVNSENERSLSDQDARILSSIIFSGSVISLVVLSISLFIFIKFKSLHCQRTSIHKNLVVSFLMRFTFSAINVEPYVFGHHAWYNDEPWLCKAVGFLLNYSYLCNFCWMLAEGLYLHLILVLRPLSNEKANFVFFYILGWVVPLLITTVFAILTHFEHDTRCWGENTGNPYIFIIYTPIMLALFVNLLILMNLVRIVIHKLCTGHQTERRKIFRTIKSTVVLVFLLGICNLLFFYGPAVKSTGTKVYGKVYRYTNAVLPPLQGIFVSFLYCFLNAEVRRAIKKRWARYQDSRHMGLRRRCSRTSMSMIVSNHEQCNGTEQSPMIEMQRITEQNYGLDCGTSMV